jgi:N4-gp56 family major capsid protein
MAINTTSTHGALLSNILQSAQFTAAERSIAANLVTVYDMTGTPGLTAQIPVYPTVSASGLTEGLDITTQTSVNPASVTVTASEIGVRADLTDLLRESSTDNVAQSVGQILGAAIGEKVDADVFDQFDSFTTNRLGTGGTDLTPDLILQAVYKLRAQNAPTDADGDYYGVFAPAAIHNVAKVLTSSGYASGGATALSNAGNSLLSSSAYLGRIYNVKLFMTTAVDVDSANDSIGGVFSPMAMAHVVKRPIVVREQYDASLRSTEYVATTARGNSIIKEQYGCRIKSESSVD